MAYGNNYGGGGYNRGGYGGGYRNNYGGGGYQGGGGGYRSRGYSGPQQSNRPKSGCKMKTNYTTREGELKECVIYGWKKTKRFGFMKFVASPAKDKYQTSNPAYTKMVVNISSPMGQSTIWANWNIQKRVLVMNDLNMVASPDGGYWSYLTPKAVKNRR